MLMTLSVIDGNRSDKDGPGKQYYTLESLLFLIRNSSVPHASYVKTAATAHVPVVRRPDRKDLLLYLQGETNNNANIDKSAPIELPISLSEVIKNQAAAGESSDQKGLQGTSSTSSATAYDDSSGPTAAKIVKFSEAQPDHDVIQKAKEKFSEQLDSRGINRKTLTVAGLGPEGNSSLKDSLSLEKIAALRAKRLAKKRNTIIDADSEFGKEAGDEPATGPSFQSLMQYDSKLTKEILARERVYRTRLTILQASGKNFAKTVFPILNSLKAREEAMKKPQIPGSAPVPASLTTPSIPSNPMSGQRLPTSVPVIPGSLQQQYNRYDQERFTRNDAGGFRIDTTGTYHGLTLKSVTEGSLPQSQTPSNPGIKAVTPGSSPSTPKKRTSRTPIIVVPATTTSLITMANATSILQNLKFVEATGAEKKEVDMLITRRKADGTVVPYRVLDNPSRLAAEDWDRVVAVFVQGPAWQFKGWPWNANPVEIFARIKAFHLKFDEMKLDANVAKWSVSVLEVSRHKRHLDRANLINFWSQLDTYMVKHKPHLKF